MRRPQTFAVQNYPRVDDRLFPVAGRSVWRKPKTGRRNVFRKQAAITNTARNVIIKKQKRPYAHSIPRVDCVLIVNCVHGVRKRCSTLCIRLWAETNVGWIERRVCFRGVRTRSTIAGTRYSIRVSWLPLPSGLSTARRREKKRAFLKRRTKMANTLSRTEDRKSVN